MSSAHDSAMKELHLLSAGAAQSVAAALIPDFAATTGARVRATFRAVGAFREMFLAAEPGDVLVSTAAMLDDFARDGRIVTASIRPLGRVQTGIAVRSGEPPPAIGSRELLRASLAAAKGIYVPDPERATPGVTLAGTLPAPFELATTYAVATCTSARDPVLAQRFVQLLSGPDSLWSRRDAGFEV